MRGTPWVRPATPADFQVLLEVREEVAVDLLQRGIASNPNALTRQHLEEWTKSRALWVAELDGSVIGSIAVWLHDPTDYWPETELATYIRDLMVSPKHRHEGLRASMLRWAERFSASRGRDRVRLDCDAANERLCRYYQDCGYRRVGIDGEGFALYEKALT